MRRGGAWESVLGNRWALALVVPLVLVACTVALLWFCLTGRWAPQGELEASAVS